MAARGARAHTEGQPGNRPVHVAPHAAQVHIPTPAPIGCSQPPRSCGPNSSHHAIDVRRIRQSGSRTARDQGRNVEGMRKRPWGILFLLLGGVLVGVGVAGVPSRGEDPPLRVDADAVTTTTTALTTTTTVPPTTVTTPPPTTSSTRRRP